jgi:Cu-processing system ATP-binding protein
MTRPDQILGVDGVSVRFGALQALREVTLSVAEGERVALLGPNGAGKSTLFKTILGFLRPNTGEVRVAGEVPGSATARLAVSYLPESVAFPGLLTGQEIIGYFARLKGEAPARALPLLDSVGLGEAARRRVGTYSKGMRQRLGLAQALIGRPQLLLLDEPTSGLDPLSRLEFYAIIERVAAQGSAVLLSSHVLTEVEARTDRVAILSKGRIVADAPLAELSRRAALPIRIRIEARDGALEALHQGIGGERFNGASVMLSCLAEEKLGVLARVTELGALIADVDIALPGLDDVYRYYGATEAKG